MAPAMAQPTMEKGIIICLMGLTPGSLVPIDSGIVIGGKAVIGERAVIGWKIVIEMRAIGWMVMLMVGMVTGGRREWGERGGCSGLPPTGTPPLGLVPVPTPSRRYLQLRFYHLISLLRYYEEVQNIEYLIT